MSGRLSQYKYKGHDEESARGKRREFAVSIRKDKRREKVSLMCLNCEVSLIARVILA